MRIEPLQVADGDAVDVVRAAGAGVMGVVDTGVCHVRFVKDPHGNAVILHQRYAP